MKQVVAGIIIKNGNPKSYLLVSSNKDFWRFTGYYYPPAGHIEKGESETDALKREIVEELWMNILEIEKITDKIKSDVKNQKTIWYLCKVDSFDYEINKEELVDANFFTKQQINKMKIWPATKELFEKYIFNTD